MLWFNSFFFLFAWPSEEGQYWHLYFCHSFMSFKHIIIWVDGVWSSRITQGQARGVKLAFRQDLHQERPLPKEHYRSNHPCFRPKNQGLLSAGEAPLKSARSVLWLWGTDFRAVPGPRQRGGGDRLGDWFWPVGGPDRDRQGKACRRGKTAFSAKGHRAARLELRGVWCGDQLFRASLGRGPGKGCQGDRGLSEAERAVSGNISNV